jgi:hypothetical protein
MINVEEIDQKVDDLPWITKVRVLCRKLNRVYSESALSASEFAGHFILGLSKDVESFDVSLSTVIEASLFFSCKFLVSEVGNTVLVAVLRDTHNHLLHELGSHVLVRVLKSLSITLSSSSSKRHN